MSTKADAGTDHRAENGLQPALSPQHEAARLVTRRMMTAGIASSLLCLLLCLPGMSLPFSYDESVTVGGFVTAPTVWDAATTQIVFNNHLVISVAGNLVWQAFDTTWEPALRVVPTLAFVTATGVLAGAVSRRWGLFAGLTAGSLMCTNPMLFGVARELRGYGLMVLCSIAATLLLVHLRATPSNTRVRVAYIAVGALGVAAQAYMLFTLALHAASIASDPSLRRGRSNLDPLLAAAVGVLVQAPLLVAGMQADRGRFFRPEFPVDLAVEVLGGSVIGAGLTLLLVASPIKILAASRTARTVLGGIGALVMVVWSLAPFDLYPRFFVALVPLVTALAGVGAARLWSRGRFGPVVSGALVVTVLVAQLAVVLPTLRQPAMTNRQVHHLMEGIGSTGATACVLASSNEPLMGYRDLDVVASAADAERCDVVISLIAGLDEPAFSWLDSSYSTRTMLTEAASPGRIYSNAPEGCIFRPVPSCWTKGGTNEPTDL